MLCNVKEHSLLPCVIVTRMAGKEIFKNTRCTDIHPKPSFLKKCWSTGISFLSFIPLYKSSNQFKS